MHQVLQCVKTCLLPCLCNLYTEYIIQNAGLDKSQAGLKIAGRNSNKLRYADDTTLMAESEKELKSLLMRVKEESEKAGLKLIIQKLKIMENRWGKNGNSGEMGKILFSWAPKSL